MSIFDDADKIMAPLREQVLEECRTELSPDAEDRSDWEQAEIIRNDDDEWSVKGMTHWKYALHPPGVPREKSGILMCYHCGCVALQLKKPYQGMSYWCLHCGPQKKIEYNR